MVGRDRERAELAADLADARQGRGRVVLLLGEAGMGKSMLAEWLVTRATVSGVRAVRGACSAAGVPPLWPWQRALGTLVPRLSWQADARTAVQAPSGRELVAAAVVEAIAATARARPLLIVLEDLHWSDPTSLVVAQAVADAAASLPVMLLLTCRDGPHEASGQVRDQLADLPTCMRRMPLPPLDLAGVARLAKESLGHELPGTDVQDLRARTGGNPFFVHEVTRLMAAHGPSAALVVPPGVREVLRRRIARLSQPCASLVTVAAVAAATAADVIEADLVCAVYGADDDEMTALLDEAAEARLLDVDPAGLARYRFRHALVREVFEQELSASERGRWHARVAEVLQTQAEAATLAPRLAYHWSRASGAGARERAAYWSLRAARDAMAESGFEAAAAHYARALASASTDRIAVSVEYGEALQLSGDPVAAREVLVAAARAASGAGRAVELAQAALALGGGLSGFEVPIWDEDQADLLRQADTALPADNVALRAAVRGRLSLALAGQVPLAERVRLAEDAVAMARAAGDGDIESAVLAAFCDAIAGPDYVAQRIAAASRMLDLASGTPDTSLRHRTSVLLGRRLLVVAYLEQGDLAAAEEQMAAYERLARRIGVARYGWLPEIWRAMRALLDGHPDLALRHAAAAQDIGRRAASFNAELMTFTVRTQAHLDRGTPEEYAGDINALLATVGLAVLPAMYLSGPARALLAAGDASHAKAVLRTFLAGTADTMPKDAEWLESHWAMVDIALHLDDRPAAAGLFEALRCYEALWAVDGIGAVLFGTVAEQLGRLAAYLGRPDEAGRYLATARERYVRLGAAALRDRLASAAARPARAQPGSGRLQRDGQVWVIEWRGRRSAVPDSKGLRDLAVLLARPGQAVPALGLVEAAGGPPAAAAGASLGPVLDDTARRAYRTRLAELDGELDEAEADADPGRAERLRTEKSMLASELSAALGLGGRARIAGDPAERARKAVTMRIRAAIAAIEAQDQALARHLHNTVRTGRLCSYQPEGEISWQT